MRPPSTEERERRRQQWATDVADQWTSEIMAEELERRRRRRRRLRIATAIAVVLAALGAIGAALGSSVAPHRPFPTPAPAAVPVGGPPPELRP